MFLLHVLNSMLFLHVFTMRAHVRDWGLQPPKYRSCRVSHFWVKMNKGELLTSDNRTSYE
ncbi:hypothetical protein C2S39_01430 [Helicobacter pylori]|nr:hypothetical protein C2S39_01430 [Helicobacter pylori]